MAVTLCVCVCQIADSWQMIVTYGQSCKFNFHTSENERDVLSPLPRWCFTQNIEIMKSDICSAFLLEHHILDTGKFLGN